MITIIYDHFQPDFIVLSLWGPVTFQGQTLKLQGCGVQLSPPGILLGLFRDEVFGRRETPPGIMQNEEVFADFFYRSSFI